MSGYPKRMADDRLDILIRGALAVEAERLSATQPPTDVALAHLSARLRSRGAGTRRRQLVALGWLALLLAAAVTAVVVGAWLLRAPTNLIVIGPFGPPSPCAETPVADGLAVEAFREEAVLMIDRSGLVTTLSGNPGDAPPEDEGGTRTRIESRFVTGVLTPFGTALVLDRVEELSLEPGCYQVRTQGGDASIYANTESGPIGLSFSWGNGEADVAPLIGPADQARLHELLDSLFALDTWLPTEAFTPLEPSDLDTWIVHTTFEPTGFDRSHVIHLGDGTVASADDRRYAALRLPGDVSILEFGSPIPGAASGGEVFIGGYIDVRAANQRCGLLGRADALVLADSFDLVRLEGEGLPDLYTPDMATAITVRLHPAVGSHSSCEGFAEAINGYVQPSAEPSAPVVGDLASLDPCSYVPQRHMGVISSGWWSTSGSPFGVAARRCVLESHWSRTTGVVERLVWLYPRSISEDEARSLAAGMFGQGVAEQRVDGSPVWLNHCLVGGLECHHAIAGYRHGKFVVLEISDRTTEAVEPATALMGEILQAIP